MAYKLDLRKTVASLCGQLSSREILQMFKDKPISRSTIFRVIKDCREGRVPCNKEKTGRPPKLSAKTTKNLLSSATNKVGQSTRRLSRKFGISRSTVHRVLKRNNMVYRKCKQEPEYTPEQLKTISKHCRILREKYFANGKSIILDDELHFSFSHHRSSAFDGYYTDNNIENPPNTVEYAGKTEFEPKVSVWLAISAKGVSVPYIRSYDAQPITADTYVSQCLPKLKQYIEHHHSQDGLMFWPDPAGDHYAKATLDWFIQQDIPFVPKKDNPPNISQARAIECFWAVLKGKVYEKGWEAKTQQQLIKRIQQKLNEIDESACQNVMEMVQNTLHKIEDIGPSNSL